MKDPSILNLSPSDFGYLWKECKRCYWLKLRRKVYQPGMFPKIFTAIDGAMRDRFSGVNSSEVSSEMPAGVFDCRTSWVESTPFVFPDRTTVVKIRGKIDSLVVGPNGTSVVDFKTTKPSAFTQGTYATQLNAYAYALLNAAPGVLSIPRLDRLGLLCFSPQSFDLRDDNGKVGSAFFGGLDWIEIPIDQSAIRTLVHDITAVLDLAEPPEYDPAADCDYCNYRAIGL